VVLADEPAQTLHRPSADVMMTSAATTYRQRCLGVILTGMGHDGQEGMAAIKRVQGRTLAQEGEELNRIVNEMLGVQEEQDWVLLADLIEYDLYEVLQRWQEGMPSLQGGGH